MAPLVSVILPVFNGERFLAAAIRSVYEQDAGPIELIVIDDGSTDGSLEVIRAAAPDARVIRQENSGPAAARNSGLAEARGDYFAFIDADDMWPPGKLERQFGVLVEDHGADMTLGRTRCILPDGTLAEPRFFMQLGCGLYYRRAFERAGGFDGTLRFSEDIDWFTRAREAGLQLRVTEDVALHYRLHEGNLTRGTDVHDLGYLPLVKRSLDRRRERVGVKPFELPPL
ncbi:MAG TPA: glycosyltransferase family A protein [Rhodothermales bacterium]|nr:glycosyltransferase family A protein [Rhodothermales bacterium]